MDDLISRSALFNIVEPRLDYLRDKNGPYDHYTDGYEECYDRIDEAPTVDAVEVVRCKDCVNYKDYTYDGEVSKWCTGWVDYLPTQPDDFCSQGEKKDND